MLQISFGPAKTWSRTPWHCCSVVSATSFLQIAPRSPSLACRCCVQKTGSRMRMRSGSSCRPGSFLPPTFASSCSHLLIPADPLAMCYWTRHAGLSLGMGASREWGEEPQFKDLFFFFFSVILPDAAVESMVGSFLFSLPSAYLGNKHMCQPGMAMAAPTVLAIMLLLSRWQVESAPHSAPTCTKNGHFPKHTFPESQVGPA